MKKFSIFLIFILSCAKSDTEKFWQDGNPLPYKVANFGWTSFNDYSTSRMIIYNNNSYQISETLIAPIYLKNSCIAVYNNKVYIFRGYIANTLETGGCFAVVLNTSLFYEFNPANNSFNQKASLKYSRNGACAVVLNGQIYVIGGDNNTISSKVFKYDPNSDNWSYVTDMKTPRKGLGSAVIGNEIYVFGGIDDNNNITNKVEIFKVSPIVF
jgi:N-acetylneuraminic acid mutarotase